MPHVDKLAVHTISARSRFAAEKQSTFVSAKLLHQLADVIWTVRNRTPVTDLSSTFALRNRNQNCRLMNVQFYEHAMLHTVSPPFVKLGTGPSGAPLKCRIPQERPPSQSIYRAIMGSEIHKTPPVMQGSSQTVGSSNQRTRRCSA